MNQDDAKFDDDFGAVLREADPAAGPCPDSAMLIAWHAGELDDGRSATVGRHVTGCAECSALAEKLGREPAPVDDMVWARASRSLDQRRWPWRNRRGLSPSRLGLIAAGIAVLAVALLWLQPSSPPEIFPATRGTAPLTVLAPSGAVSQLEFRWQPVPIHHAYVIEITRDGNQIAAIETWRPPLPADAELLDRLETGTPYRWRVRAVDASGETLAASDWTEFQLRD